MTTANIERMNTLIHDEAFVAKYAEAGNHEDAYKLLIEYGVDATYEDYLDYMAESEKVLVDKGMIDEDGELSAEMLEMVAGGGKGKAVICFILAGVAFYVGAPQAGVLLCIAGIAFWNQKKKKA